MFILISYSYLILFPCNKVYHVQEYPSPTLADKARPKSKHSFGKGEKNPSKAALVIPDAQSRKGWVGKNKQHQKLNEFG